VAARLDYELKDELYSKIARVSKLRQQTQHAVREETLSSSFWLYSFPSPSLLLHRETSRGISASLQHLPAGSASSFSNQQ
jgi:hypothetical protein